MQSIAQPISAHSLILLLVTQVAVILPHIMQMPVWIIAVAIGCLFWRWMIFLEHWIFPPGWLKAGIALITCAAAVIGEGVQHKLETWTSLLLLAFCLKLIETRTCRDAYALIFMAYFVLCIEFIFNQSILMTGYQSLCVILATAAMISLNQARSRTRSLDAVHLAGKLVLQSLPLMLVVFIVFPRVAPFWSVPLKNSAQSGLATEMSPGDIAQLALSDEIVFRAMFDQKPPPIHKLYWRGLVYSDFHLGKWSKGPIPGLRHERDWIDWGNDLIKSDFVPNLARQKKISYRVLLEPTDQIWQFGLDLAIPTATNSGLSWDFRLVSREPMNSLTHYAVDTYPEVILDAELPAWSRRRETRLPERDNPRSVAYARKLYQASENEQAFIDQLLNEIRSSSFHYTLQPPTLDRINSIDQFWFDTKAGFCAHYAGAMVYMLRAAGIPARMIGGYQGGEINPVSGHVVVRQYHAHAWVEAWIEGRGWQRFDPTAAVAPERVELGLDAALQEQDRSSLSAFTHARLSNSWGLARWMYAFESLEHRWKLFVVGYDAVRQGEFLRNLLGQITPVRMALIVLFGILLSLMWFGISLLVQQRCAEHDRLIRLLKMFSRKMAGKGFSRKPSESFSAYLRRIGNKSSCSAQWHTTAHTVELLLYGSKTPASTQQIADIKNELNLLYADLKEPSH